MIPLYEKNDTLHIEDKLRLPTGFFLFDAQVVIGYSLDFRVNDVSLHIDRLTPGPGCEFVVLKCHDFEFAKKYLFGDMSKIKLGKPPYEQALQIIGFHFEFDFLHRPDIIQLTNDLEHGECRVLEKLDERIRFDDQSDVAGMVDLLDVGHDLL
jgi:hypothetical protein